MHWNYGDLKRKGLWIIQEKGCCIYFSLFPWWYVHVFSSLPAFSVGKYMFHHRRVRHDFDLNHCKLLGKDNCFCKMMLACELSLQRRDILTTVNSQAEVSWQRDNNRGGSFRFYSNGVGATNTADSTANETGGWCLEMRKGVWVCMCLCVWVCVLLQVK